MQGVVGVDGAHTASCERCCVGVLARQAPDVELVLLLLVVDADAVLVLVADAPPADTLETAASPVPPAEAVDDTLPPAPPVVPPLEALTTVPPQRAAPSRESNPNPASRP